MRTTCGLGACVCVFELHQKGSLQSTRAGESSISMGPVVPLHPSGDVRKQEQQQAAGLEGVGEGREGGKHRREEGREGKGRDDRGRRERKRGEERGGESCWRRKQGAVLIRPHRSAC